MRESLEDSQSGAVGLFLLWVCFLGEPPKMVVFLWASLKNENGYLQRQHTRNFPILDTSRETPSATAGLL